MVRIWRRRRMRVRLHADTRAVLDFAKEEAAGLDHTFVGSGHILLGLLRGPDGPAARSLAERMSLESARTEVRDLAPVQQDQKPGVDRGQDEPTSPLPFSPHVREALLRAHRESGLRRAPEIAPEHLLMAILGETDGTASKVLARLEVDRPGIQRELHKYWEN